MNDLGTAISLPFRFGNEQGALVNGVIPVGTGGAVINTNDYRVIWRDRVYLATLTALGERIMRPYYGTEVLKSLFETEAEAVELCTDSVTSAFSTQLPGLKLTKVGVTYSPDSGQLGLDMEYLLPTGILDSVSFSTDTFNRYGEIIRRGS